MSGEKNCCQRFIYWLATPPCLIYVNYLLTSWDERMWSFAVGLYLVYLEGGVLRLAAIYGFSVGLTILLLGGIVGNWVDRTGRWRVIQVSLCLQNCTVALSSGMVAFVLYYEDEYMNDWGAPVQRLCQAAIIILAVLAEIGNLGYKISIERDWIVVIADGDTATLANLNAKTRSINLMCKIMAPSVTGLIMTFASLFSAALFVSLWNVGSLILEYALLRHIYVMVPRLAFKLDEKGQELDEVAGQKQDQDQPEVSSENDDQGEGHPEVKETEIGVPDDEPGEEAVTDAVDEAKSQDTSADPVASQSTEEEKTCLQLMFAPCIILVKGWHTYAKQRVVYAGISLACLYMTVLGFDSITTGYIYAQNISEAIVGVSMALGGATGILGAYIYAHLSQRIGLERTGLFAFNSEVLCLILCVACIWAPGSPFDPLENSQCTTVDSIDTFTNFTTVPPTLNVSNVNSLDSFTTVPPTRNVSNVNSLDTFTNFTTVPPTLNVSNVNSLDSFTTVPPTLNASNVSLAGRHVRDVSKIYSPESEGDLTMAAAYFLSPELGVFRGIGNRQKERVRRSTNEEEEEETECDEYAYTYEGLNISVILFMLGIITSRVGLWMADLVVTQLQQEHVVEKERGIVNGVQNSLNMMMDMTKFIMVIFLPHIQRYGFLILASFLFVCFGGCFFAFHSWRERGHLLPRVCSKHEEKGEKTHLLP